MRLRAGRLHLRQAVALVLTGRRTGGNTAGAERRRPLKRRNSDALGTPMHSQYAVLDYVIHPERPLECDDPSHRVQLYLLGGFRLVSQGQCLSVRTGGKTEAFLAYLGL